MHYLHKILVHVPDCIECEESWDEKKEAIRDAAESGTEDFYDRVFDWRETDCAGRWEGIYPEQVYLAADNINWFIDELIEVRNSQEADMQSCMEELRNSVGLDLETIRNKIDEHECGFMMAYYLSRFADILSGEYISASGFYNLRDYTAKVTPDIIEEIKAQPNNWALVMFDYHN